MSKQQGQIIPIFPTPILTSNIGREFTLQEMQCIKEYSNDTFSNAGNVTTNDLYVLNHPALADLKAYCEDSLRDYLINIYNPVNPDEIELGITQSWLNYTNNRGFHHFHHHPNSVISGALYISADKSMDNITFNRTLSLNLQVQSKKQNPFNSVEMVFPVGTGDVVLFPSDLTHGVSSTQGNYTRISLAFNSYFSGKIGYIEGPLQGFNFLNVKLEDQTINNPYKKRYE
jgi:uncharacterized protein (TIGR02466 family)